MGRQLSLANISQAKVGQHIPSTRSSTVRHKSMHVLQLKFHGQKPTAGRQEDGREALCAPYTGFLPVFPHVLSDFKETWARYHFTRLSQLIQAVVFKYRICYSVYVVAAQVKGVLSQAQALPQLPVPQVLKLSNPNSSPPKFKE